MNESVIFQPEVSIYVLIGIALLTLLAVAIAVIRRLPGWWLRALAGLVLLAALANPSLKQEERDPLADIAFVVLDETASQSITPRPEQLATAEAALREALDREGEALRVETVRVGDPTGDNADRGTLLVSALARAAAEAPSDRIAGAIIVSDGQIDDVDDIDSFPAPIHLLLTGEENEWDRRLEVVTVPTFGIIGEPVTLELRVEDSGAVPRGQPASIPLLVSVDGGPEMRLSIPIGETVSASIELEHGGANVIQLTVPLTEGELTDRNNSAVVSINGVRDRLRVLLVSGEPHAGERTWRNLLKSDPAVDLVHFTILRPPHKQDGVPVHELSLIAFPTRELFLEKIDEFDLIIFDRYRRRGVLPRAYLENIADYVREGGAVLVASGPSFASAESLHRTPLADILPVTPTARVIEEGYVPRISEIGLRHPVTSDLETFAPRPSEDGIPGWGQWFRLIDTIANDGHVVMTGPGERPLLTLARPGEGRIAALSSDHAWLWSRGFDGGGPQRELLRRLAHWLMQEPELEEEVLTARVDGQDLIVTRRTMDETVGALEIIAPNGEEITREMTPTGPGSFETRIEDGENGLFRLAQGTTRAVVALGPAAPKEFEMALSTDARMEPLLAATGGGVFRVVEGMPDIRRVREGRIATGRGWVGLPRREAYDVLDIRLTPLAPGWLMLLLSAGLMLIAWRVEGR